MSGILSAIRVGLRDNNYHRSTTHKVGDIALFEMYQYYSMDGFGPVNLPKGKLTRDNYRGVNNKNPPLTKTPAPTFLRYLEIIKPGSPLSKLKMWRKSKARRRRKFLGVF